MKIQCFILFFVLSSFYRCLVCCRLCYDVVMFRFVAAFYPCEDDSDKYDRFDQWKI